MTMHETLQSLRREVQHYRQVFEHLQDSVISLDLDGYISRWSPAARRLFGYSEEEMVGRHILFLYADESAEDAFLFNRFLERDHQFTVKHRRKSGEVFWARMMMVVERDEQGEPSGLLCFLFDVNSEVEREEEERLRARIIEYCREAIVVTDKEMLIRSINPAYLQVLGLHADTNPCGQPISWLNQEALGHDTWQAFHQELEATGSWQGELQGRRGDGSVFHMWLSFSRVSNQFNEVVGYFGVFSDLTEHKAAEERIHRLAYYDGLTELPNRNMFLVLLEQALAEARRTQAHGAVLCVGLGRLGLFNETLGYQVADRLIVEAAKRLRNLLRGADVLARMGGGRFLVGLFDIANKEDAAIVAERVHVAFAEPFADEYGELAVTVNAGISVFPPDGFDAAQLVGSAELAMNRAKQEGEPWLFFAKAMQQRAVERLHLDGLIRHGLAHNEFRLHYQPQIDAESGELIGAEALLRLERPDGRLVPPGVFIPFAEETGLIVHLGAFVISACCQQLALWREQGLPSLRVAVNLSAHQLRPGLTEFILGELLRYGVSPEQLEVELTETAFMRNDPIVQRVLGELREAGILMALDDFGTGYSNLAILRRFPVNFLKIDRSFVMGLPGDEEDCVILDTILSMARTLRLQTIAEGVETLEQADYLRAQGCQLHQGYYYAKPLPADEFAAWWLQRNSEALNVGAQ